MSRFGRRLKDAFQMLDVEGSGYITRGTLADVLMFKGLAELSAEEVSEVVREVIGMPAVHSSGRRARSGRFRARTDENLPSRLPY